MQIVSTCTKGKGHSMVWHRRHRVGSILVVLLVLNGVVNDRLRPLYARENSPATHRTGFLVGPRKGLDGCEKSKQAYVYCYNQNFNRISIITQKFVFLSLFSINIFCITWIVTNWFKTVSLFSLSMVARLVNNFFSHLWNQNAHYRCQRSLQMTYTWPTTWATRRNGYVVSGERSDTPRTPTTRLQF